MTLTFRDNLDAADTLLSALDAVTDLVGSPSVEQRWAQESALPGWSIGGLTRHLVSQGETAAEFLGFGGVPPHAPDVDLVGYYARADWFMAGVDEPENTSIRDEFDAMAAIGPHACREILASTRAALPALLAGAGPRTYVPWQDCALSTEDFVVCRLLELVVHADDLAASVGEPGPDFGPDVLTPVVATLAVLAAGRHGAGRVVRALARSERAEAGVSAFG